MYAVFDIGGTKTRVAASADGVTLGVVQKFDTPATYDEGISQLVEAIRTCAGDSLMQVSGGIRGHLASDGTRMVRDHLLPEWQEKPLVQDLSAALGVPVMLENDAALAALGEAHRGAGKGSDIVAYHTISTGVGGARIDHGEIDAHSLGFEPGHQIIDIDDTGAGVELEDIISGTAVERRFGKKPYEIPQEDPLWDELARVLAYGLRNTTAYWSPDVIVLGGSMVLGEPQIPLEAIRRHAETVCGDTMLCPPIALAALGDSAGLYGALVRSNA